MKKPVGKIMVLVMAISVLTMHSVFPGFLRTSASGIDDMQAAQTTAQAAVNDLSVTSDLTALDVETAVDTALGAGSGYTLTWAQPLQVIRATNGAIVKLKENGVYVEKGRVKAYDGSATGLLLVKKDGETAAVIVDRVITATYETYEFDTASQITTSSANDRYGLNMDGFVKDAPLVIVDGGTVYNNLIRANNINNTEYAANESSYQAIKAVIFNSAAHHGAAALLGLPNLEVVIFSSNVKSFGTNFMQNVPKLKYVRLESTNTAGLELGESMFGDSAETSTSPIETLHIKSTASVAFTKTRSLSLVGLKQVIVDTDSVGSVSVSTFRHITNNVQVVCNNAAVAKAFNSVTYNQLGTGGSVSAIDRSKPTLLAAAVKDYLLKIDAEEPLYADADGVSGIDIVDLLTLKAESLR